MALCVKGSHLNHALPIATFALLSTYSVWRDATRDWCFAIGKSRYSQITQGTIVCPQRLNQSMFTQDSFISKFRMCIICSTNKIVWVCPRCVQGVCVWVCIIHTHTHTPWNISVWPAATDDSNSTAHVTLMQYHDFTPLTPPPQKNIYKLEIFKYKQK